MKALGQFILSILFLAIVIEFILVGPTEIKDQFHQAIGRPATKAIKNNELVNEKILDKKDEQVQQAMAGIHVIETKNENKEWELWAENAIGLKMQGDLTLQDIKASFFADKGISFEVIGRTGSISSGSKNMTVGGGVVTTSSNGYIFNTTSLEYNSKKRTLLSPTQVQVSGPPDLVGKRLSIQGEEMLADLNLGTVSIERNVKAKKRIQRNQNMEVLAEKVNLSGHTKAVQFSGNVAIRIDGMNINSPDALFKYNPNTEQLESIDLEGGVKVKDIYKVATSEKLSINLVKNEYVFSGNPRVVQDNDEVRGDKIIFLDGGKKVKIQNAKVKVSEDTMKKNKYDRVK